MVKTLIKKRFLVAIFGSLMLATAIFIALLWDRFHDLDQVASEHVLHEKAVVLVKDTRYHVVQIQQFLTDVSLTHRVEGFEHAKTHLQQAQQALKTLTELSPALQGIAQQLNNDILNAYETGVRMATNYLYKDTEMGNLTMKQLDRQSEHLTRILDDLALLADSALQDSVVVNDRTIHRNEMILMFSVPLVLGVFGFLILKTTLMLNNQMKRLELRTSQLNAILDTAPSAIITMDQAGKVINFNAAAEKIFGYAAEEIIGLNVTTLMPAAVAAEHSGYVQRYIANSESQIIGNRREIEGVRKNGEVFPAQLRVNAINLNDELFFCGVLDDISETKILQSQLNQAQKLEAIGQLASGIAHEINTPIQYIGDNLSALNDYFNDIKDFHHSLTQINDEALNAQLQALSLQYDLAYIMDDCPKAIKQSKEGVERVAEIVKAMKSFSHVETSLGAQTINLSEAIQNALIISRNTYKYHAAIATDFSDEVKFVQCYPNELNQVFLNMIVNAAHAIEERQASTADSDSVEKGLIRITTRPAADMVEILIADNGAGIPEAIKEKVFNLFFTTKAVGKGTGQGLALSHNIVVEKHHGKLYFDSTPGQGTTFHILLPIKQESTNTANND